MNVLNIKERTSILRCLVEGNSIRSTARITGHARATVDKLLVNAGKVSQQYQDKYIKGLDCNFVQVDEIWAFVGCKEKGLKMGKRGLGDVWTWVAMDSETKLVIHYETGDRGDTEAHDMMRGLGVKITGRFQLTTDGFKKYPDAVEKTFRENIDFAMSIKNYEGKRYESTTQNIINGNPEENKISTSLIERQNLTMRMGMRRFTRKTNAFSKKLDNHKHAIALHFFYYNFVRIHKTIKTTPAIKAGISKAPLKLEDLARMVA